MQQPQKRSLLELAAGILSRRNQTKMELRKKLYRKSDADPQEIEDTLTRLEEMGIQDGDTVDIYDIEFEYQR